MQPDRTPRVLIRYDLPMTTQTPSDPGPELPDVQMHLHRPNDPGEGVIVENRICTRSSKSAGFVRHLVVDISGTDLAGRFRVGQSFGTIPPGVTEKGRSHRVRLYSLSCPTAGEDGQGTLISTTVKRLIDEHWETKKLFLGLASNWLCDLQVGTKIPITGPAGKRFLLPKRPEEHDYIFFATGTGIAPFRGMIHELLSSGVQSQIVLIMGAPYATDLLYHEELEALAEQHAHFTYLTALSRELQLDGGVPIYVQGRLETHRDQLGTLLRTDRALIYACGLSGMELGIFRGLHQVLEGQHLERYLKLDPEIAGDPASWTRRMVNRQVAPTRRIFLEVY